MTSTLGPCPCCHRHVRTLEPRCPFCAGALGARAVEPPPVVERLGRAALFAFRASTAAALVGLAACGTSDRPPEETIAQPYGAPPEPPRPDPFPEPPRIPEETIAQPYGAPPDPRPEPPPVPDPDGAGSGTASMAQPYGGAPMRRPPNPDEPTRPDEGNAVPAYGAPPPDLE
jgi:hypothetical protein